MVSEQKAFQQIQVESGMMRDGDAVYESQAHEAQEAKCICKCRHYAFLCRDLGLPCAAAAVITQYVVEHPPFIFAEPGDLWLDIRLTTPNRTYVLARPHKETSSAKKTT